MTESADSSPPPAPRPGHVPVLLERTIEVLDPQSGETALDCTAGLGGHAEAIARRIGPSGTLVLNDADPSNLAAAAQRLRDLPEPPAVIMLRGNFADAPRRMLEQGLAADVVLADLGFASTQIEDPARGLSFQREGPLDMRFDPESPVTAAVLVNTLPEEELAEIIRDFGEDREARRIARKLVEARKDAPIDSTVRLAQIVRSAMRGGREKGRIDPATRTFQALRIAVNDELGSLAALLEAVGRAATSLKVGAESRPTWLRRGARVCVISFHSLEDRPVKRLFADLTRRGMAPALTKKPDGATDEEIASNPRARSARLRAIRVG
ncbi:MAG: 16S rRNA (cytosine(1402)-N(4))-methyltransferase RsmH [Phycisphaeraceae bacterium]|nr:MAG: 16S rRNA (cytosine(1402)-N(4))-methyltransferase RsmH [Phycisphaeraceae bacterium]